MRGQVAIVEKLIGSGNGDPTFSNDSMLPSYGKGPRGAPDAAHHGLVRTSSLVTAEVEV